MTQTPPNRKKFTFPQDPHNQPSTPNFIMKKTENGWKKTYKKSPPVRKAHNDPGPFLFES